MSALLPLILLWLSTRRTAPPPSAAAPRKAAPPRWPTPASPPPMPAFQSAPTPSADPSHSSTPLADLHNNPPSLAPASNAEPAAIKAKAIAAFKKKSTSLLQQRLASSPFGSSATTVPVASLQRILIKRGVKLAPDGLYGPRTAQAWAKLATSRLLPPTISRVGPKSARVVTRTFDSLSVPAIP
jgi:hypothetical protein